MSEMTETRKLAEEYLRLGGRRKLKADDNIITIRKWEEDPPEAEKFWVEHIEPLDQRTREQVELYLPSINFP